MTLVVYLADYNRVTFLFSRCNYTIISYNDKYQGFTAAMTFPMTNSFLPHIHIHAHLERVQETRQHSIQEMELDFTHRLLYVELCFCLLSTFAYLFIYVFCWAVCLYLRATTTCLLEPTCSLCSGDIRRFLWKPSHPACTVYVCICVCVSVCVRVYVRAHEQRGRVKISPPRLLQDVFFRTCLEVKWS